MGRRIYACCKGNASLQNHDALRMCEKRIGSEDILRKFCLLLYAGYIIFVVEVKTAPDCQGLPGPIFQA